MAKWYLANIVEFPIIRDKKTLEIMNYDKNLYWDNLVLIKSNNSENAYKKAVKYGKEGEYQFINTDGDYGEWKFAGVRELVLIDNPLEDCEDIAYEEGYVKNFKSIRKMIPTKSKLTLFIWEKEQKKRREKEKLKNKYKRKSKTNWEEIRQERKETEKKLKLILGDINKKI